MSGKTYKKRITEPYRARLATPLPRDKDRRVKLTDTQRQHMRDLRKSGYSYSELANHFGVSKRLAIFVVNPDKLFKARTQFLERRKDGRYKPTKESWRQTMREHRHYKLSIIKHEK